MQTEIVLKLIKQMLETAMIVGAPLLLVALVVGVAVSVIQVVTSIQDATLSFIPRIIALFAVFLLIFPWMLQRLTSYTVHLLAQLNSYIW